MDNIMALALCVSVPPISIGKFTMSRIYNVNIGVTRSDELDKATVFTTDDKKKHCIMSYQQYTEYFHQVGVKLCE